MRYENGLRGNFQYFWGYLLEFWGISHHVVIYSRKPSDKERYITFWIHQGSILIHHLMPIKFKNGYFGNFITLDSVTSGFYVYNAVQNKKWKKPL